MKMRKRISRDDMRKGIYILPNLFTSASMLFGFLSIFRSVQGEFVMAAGFIVVAMVLDGLDGRIARVTKTTSNFGAQYDSLADVISFGVAPAVMVYKWSLEPCGNWGLAVAFLLLACGALRLARFNIQIGLIDSKYFNGLPITMQAAVVSLGVLFHHKLGFEGTFTHSAVMITVVALSLLMVSSIKFYSFKNLNFFARKPLMSFVLIIITLAVVLTEPQVTFFVFCCGYVLSGPVLFAVKSIKAYRLEHGDKGQRAEQE